MIQLQYTVSIVVNRGLTWWCAPHVYEPVPFSRWPGAQQSLCVPSGRFRFSFSPTAWGDFEPISNWSLILCNLDLTRTLLPFSSKIHNSQYEMTVVCRKNRSQPVAKTKKMYESGESEFLVHSITHTQIYILFTILPLTFTDVFYLLIFRNSFTTNDIHR